MVSERVKPARLLPWLGLLAWSAGAAQEEDLTLPPRLDGTPFEARLATPRTESAWTTFAATARRSSTASANTMAWRVLAAAPSG